VKALVRHGADLGLALAEVLGVSANDISLMERPEEATPGGSCSGWTFGDLLDHLVGACQDQSWNFDPDRPRSFEINYQLELGRLLDG
jgi:hypothetical protein